MNQRLAVAALILCSCASLGGGVQSTSAQPPSQPEPKSQPPSQVSVQETNDAFVQKIIKQIAGHEQEPAEKVFKNIHILNTVPAGRFLLIMNRGYSHSLGVTCTHCHAENDFASEEKRPKRAAREMAAMHRSINDQITKMQNLAPSPKPHFINCGSCHHGHLDP